MVSDIVLQVLADNTPRQLTLSAPPPAQKPVASQGKQKKPASDKPKEKRIRAGMKCPLCGQGKVIKGRTAYGCSRWKEGCTFRQAFKA